MSKKLLFPLLMWAMIFNICALTSCKHKCEYGDWKTQTEATCTEDGLMYRECSKCGKKETQTVAATGHSESDWIVDNEATCTIDGSKHTECTVCGQTIQTETISNTGHKWDDGKVTNEPTCTIKGEKTYTCSVCGDVKTETIPVNENHTYGDDAVKISEDGKTAMLDCECEACHKKLQSPYTGYIVKNNIAYQFENGSKKDISNGEIVFNGNTYYVIDNVIQIEVYIRIENNIYYYGENGIKSTESISNKEVTDNSGNTYYVINNIIQINVYIRIENNIYYYGENGVKSTESITNKEVTDNSGNTYYVVNNKVQTNVYVRIENNIYYYGKTGVKSNDSLNNIKVTDNNGKTYYVINNIIQINVYIIIENHVYYFDTDGFMIANGKHDGYNFGANGALTGSNISIEIDNTIYEVNEGVVTLHTVCVDANCEHICDICGKKSSKCVTEDDNAIWNKLIDSTCTTTGTLGHYHCDICGKDFDKENNELKSLVIELKDHNYVNGYCTMCNKSDSSEGLAFTLSSDNTYYLVSGIGTCQDTDIVIPSTYEGLPVSEIASEAFEYCKSLTSIKIPSSVTSIGKSAFESCSSLTNVYYEGTIEDWCNIEFDTYTSNPMIYAQHFYMLDSNKEYKEVTEIEIPDTITTIGKYQFYGFNNITKITISSSVTSIGSYAFYNCSSLTNVYYEGTIGNWCNITFDSDGSNPMSYAQHFHMLDSNKEYKEVTEIEIPDTITTIGKYQFYGFNNITKITIPSSVTSIGDRAFYKCSSLTSIEIPSSVTSIGSYAFYNTAYYNNESNWEDRVLYIGNHLIEANTSISSKYVIKEGTLTIADYAFRYCSRLTSIEIPSSVTSIGYSAFSSCSNLTSVTISSSVTSIGEAAFFDCSNLTNVYYEGTIEDWCNIKFSSVTSNPMYYNVQHFYMLDSNKEYNEVTEIVIPDTITKIGKDQFYRFNNLTKINIPSSVTSIGEAAFRYCSSLTSIEIPSSVTSIGNDAFSGCSSLTNVYYEGTIEDWCNIEFDDYYSNPMSYAQHFYMLDSNKEYKEVTEIEIPDTITEISNYRFKNFTALKSITIPSSVTSIGNDAFSGCSSLTNVYYEGTIEDWCNIKFSSVTSNPMYYNAQHFYMLDSNKEYNEVTEIVIPDTITKIGNYQFSGFNNVTKITIPSSVTSIGIEAFFNCSSLTSIEIQSSVTSIGQDAFSWCGSLTIYCEASSEPSGWDSDWNSNYRPVVWDYKNNK